MHLILAVLLQAIWTGPPGGGMLGVQEPAVAPAAHGACGIVLDNYDRDPLGLDIDEVRSSCRIGLGHRWELYGSYYFSRAVTIPGAHPAPPPPLDIVTGPVPQAPYRAIYWPLPYVSKRSSGVGDFIPGDGVFGIKRLLVGQSGAGPSVSVSANVIAPASTSLRNLHRGGSAGSIDGAIHLAAGWTLGRWTCAANVGYIKSGPLPYHDRVITPDGAVDLPLKRPDFVRSAFGVRFRLSGHVAFMAEAFNMEAVGARTPTLDSAGATDVLAGIQVDAWRLTFTAGFRQHLMPPPDKMVRPTGPLADTLGLPRTYLTHTTGNDGTVLLVGFRF